LPDEREQIRVCEPEEHERPDLAYDGLVQLERLVGIERIDEKLLDSAQ
jgi:hypothetical protein